MIENDRLLNQIISQNIANIVVNSSLDINTSVNVNSSADMNDSVNYVEMCNKCLELEAELIKQHNMVEKDEYNRLSKSFSKLEQHCISLELAMQLNKEIFQKNNTSVNQTEPSIDQLKFKGKDIVDNAAQVSNATTVAPGMYKLDPVTLAPKDKNNRETHIYYLKHTMEQAAILREIVEQAKLLNPLDSASYSACKYVKLIQELLGYVRDTCPDIHKPSEKLVAVTPINKKKTVRFAKPVISSSTLIRQINAQKHMNERSLQLTNFVHKFLDTIKFGNDQIAKIVGYGDYHIGNITISRVYYVEGLGHNLFFVGSREEPTFIHLSIGDMNWLFSNLSLVQKPQRLIRLWHRRLSHLNFGAINYLAKNGLIRGLPKLKFEKDHLCSAYAMGKSKKQSHKPKSKDTNKEKLYLLHMDLCGPMRVTSINGKKYILIIVDDYSRFTWVKFLASKDEAPDFIINF
ncbi:retrovirus-related pol polyprotein from transposon TNT 1-94 [Tanacetum coccineum]